MAGGTAGTARATIAMITMVSPGTPSGMSCRGARNRGCQGQHRAALSPTPTHPPGQPAAVRHRQQGRRHRRDPGQARRHGPRREGRDRRRHPRRRVQLRLRPTGKPWVSRSSSVRTKTIAGQAAGQRLAAEGAKKSLCVIHEQGNVSLETRCAGIKEGLAGGEMENLYVNGNDMTSVEATITAKLQQDPRSTTSPAGLRDRHGRRAGQGIHRQPRHHRHLRHRRRTRRAIKDKTSLGQRSATVPAGLSRRGLAVAIPQQPQHHRRRASRPLTGPSFIDKSNIDAIAQYATNGTR